MFLILWCNHWWRGQLEYQTFPPLMTAPWRWTSLSVSISGIFSLSCRFSVNMSETSVTQDQVTYITTTMQKVTQLTECSQNLHFFFYIYLHLLFVQCTNGTESNLLLNRICWDRKWKTNEHGKKAQKKFPCNATTAIQGYGKQESLSLI